MARTEGVAAEQGGWISKTAVAEGAAEEGGYGCHCNPYWNAHLLY